MAQQEHPHPSDRLSLKTQNSPLNVLFGSDITPGRGGSMKGGSLNARIGEASGVPEQDVFAAVLRQAREPPCSPGVEMRFRAHRFSLRSGCEPCMDRPRVRGERRCVPALAPASDGAIRLRPPNAWPLLPRPGPKRRCPDPPRPEDEIHAVTGRARDAQHRPARRLSQTLWPCYHWLFGLHLRGL